MSNTTKEISVVLPCYKSEKYIKDLHKHISSTINSLKKSYEIIFVDDGSPDNGWEIIQSLCKVDKNVVGVQLSRNFGQHSAIYAGLKNCTGEWIVVMDSDMQDHPNIIKDLYLKTQEGFDTVFAKRTKQNASLFKRLGSTLFYKTFNYLTEMKIPEQIGNYGIYNKNVINSVLTMKEYRRNFVIMVNWVGFKKTSIDTFRDERILSESTYNIYNMLRLALSTIVYFSNKPMKLITEIGFLISISSTVMGIYFIIQKTLYGTPVSGWTSIIVSMFILGGIQISFMGIIGVYLGQVFYQTKNRPCFITKKVLKK